MEGDTRSRWEESLEPQIEEARAALKPRDPCEVARDCGTHYLQEGNDGLELRFFDRAYTVEWPEIVVRDSAGKIPGNPVQATLLQHLVMADGTPLAGRWVSLRELPNGAFYERAFQGYTGNLLARAFRNDLEGFREVAWELGGEPLELGDAAFRFWALPRIPLAVVYWSGGDEFPSSSQVLFDASAGHYHHLEMLAHLGGMLTRQLISAYEEENDRAQDAS